ncbi:hypothetical protein BG006_010304 [Podila minutissima]|uniref:Uncharacterized protein n=1 Tax=Podila minutissima TaxID=64525 RepID=A0A9P5SDC3_9FUNG|nr:hypothetical protein BG006_010304 [Podila minutissima]
MTENPTTTTTPYTTRYVTTITIIIVTTRVPQTIRISGSITTVYVNKTVTTRKPTTIRDPNQEPPPPSSETHGDASGLQTWQLTLIVVASLVVCLAVGAATLVGWIRNKRRRNIPFTKLDLRSAGLEPWDDERHLNKGSGTGTTTASQRGNSPGGSSPGRTAVTARAMPASGMDYEHGPYLEVYDPNQGPIALRSLNEDMQHYEQYGDWPERPSEDLYAQDPYGYQPRFLDDDDRPNPQCLGHASARLPHAGPSSVSYPAPPRPSISTTPGTSPSSPALYPLLEGRVSEITENTEGHTQDRGQSSGVQRAPSSNQGDGGLGSRRGSQDGISQAGVVASRADATRLSIGIAATSPASALSPATSEASTSETGPLSAWTTLLLDPEQLEQNSKNEHFRQGPQALLGDAELILQNETFL